MLKSLKKMLQLPLHPWLIGVFPILYLYEQNFGLVIDNDIPLLIFWVLLATTIAFVALHAASRNAYRAALITSCLSAFFSLSGHLHSLIAESEPLSVWTSTMLIMMAILIAELHKLRSDRIFEQVTLPMNLVLMAMILLQIAALYPQFTAASTGPLSMRNGEAATAGAASSPKIQDSAERPDIYYIIPDAYPSDDWLQNIVGYDNAKFTEALEGRGFVVTSHAQANYGSTLASLSSTLNMRHHSTNPTTFSDSDYMRYSIANSEVAKYLQRIGYTYIQLLSGFLLPSSIADINRDFTPSGSVNVSIDENDIAVALWVTGQKQRKHTDRRHFYQQSLVRFYLETTLLKPIADQLYRLLQRDKSISYDIFAPERFLDTIKELKSIAALPEATFTLVHLLKPHSPTVFDKYGNVIGRKLYPKRHEHLNELEYVNSKFIEMIDLILKTSRHQPVIIFQADHGSTHGVVSSHEGRLIHFDIYSAYHIPDQFSLEIPRPFTSINTFPLILNAVFDAQFQFKANRLFELLAGGSNLSAQEDVTDSFLHR